MDRREFLKATAFGVIGTIGAISVWKPDQAEASFCDSWVRLFDPARISGQLPIQYNPNDPEGRDRSGLVREIQIRIAGWAADAPEQKFVRVTNRFDLDTEAALKRFQKAYGLPQTGVFTQEEAEILNQMEKDDGSTINYNWSDFYSGDGMEFYGGNEPDPEVVKENIRILMWRLEAMNKKLGTKLEIRSGFRSIAHNEAVGGNPDSYTTYGIAVDVKHPTLSLSQIVEVAKTCGFSGIQYLSSSVYLDMRNEFYKEHPRYGEWYWD